MRQQHPQRPSSAAGAVALAANSKCACGMVAAEPAYAQAGAVSTPLHTHIKLHGLAASLQQQDPEMGRPFYDDGSDATAEPIRQSEPISHLQPQQQPLLQPRTVRSPNINFDNDVDGGDEDGSTRKMNAATSSAASRLQKQQAENSNSRRMPAMRRRTGASPDRMSVVGNGGSINICKSSASAAAGGFGYGGGCTPPKSAMQQQQVQGNNGSSSPVQQLRSKVLANRDKESLMDEILQLKKALTDHTAQLQRQKVVSANLDSENRRLERELEEIELQGYSKSSSSRLRLKVQGLKARVSQLESTCEAQQEELIALHRDIRVTHTRELEVERDVCLEEVERLQNFVRRLKATQNRLYCENKQLWHYKDRNSLLEATTQRLETSSIDLQKSLEKANKEIQEILKKGNDNFIRAKKAEHQCQDLQEKSNMLKEMVEKERSQNLKLQQMIHVLQDEVQTLGSSIDSKTITNTCSIQDLHNGCDPSRSLAKSWGFLHNLNFHHHDVRQQIGEVKCHSKSNKPKVQNAFRANQDIDGKAMKEIDVKTHPTSTMVPQTNMEVQKFSTMETKLPRREKMVQNATSNTTNKEHAQKLLIECSSNVEDMDDLSLNSTFNLMKEDEQKCVAEIHQKNVLQARERIYIKKGKIEEELHEKYQVNTKVANVFVPRLNLDQIGGNGQAQMELSSQEVTTSSTMSSSSSNGMIIPCVSNVNERLFDKNDINITHVNDQILNIKEVIL